MPFLVFSSTFFSSSIQIFTFNVFGGEIALFMIFALLLVILQMMKVNLSLQYVEICIKSEKRIMFASTEETT